MRAHEPERSEDGLFTPKVPKRPTESNTARGREDNALSEQRLVELQRTIGNASVSELLTGRGGDEPSPAERVAEPGDGERLDPETRDFMEARLGHDFNNVRVHAGPDASASANALNAHAFTVGNDIVFAEGRFDPRSSSGKRLLAHELTHVVQQGQGSVSGVPLGEGIQISDPADRFEREARSTATQAMSGHRPERASHSGIAIHREEGDESEDKSLKDLLVRDVGGKAKDKATKWIKKKVTGKTGDEEEEAAQAADTPKKKEFVDNLTSGMKSAKEWLEWVKKAGEYYKATGIKMPLGPAVQALGHIAETLLGGIEKAQFAIEVEQNLFKLLNSLDDVVVATRQLDLADPKSVEDWAKTAKDVDKTFKPFGKLLGAQLRKLGMAGSEAAAEAFIVFGYVLIEVEAGLELLEAGTKAIEKGKEREEEAYRIGGGYLPPPVQVPPAPGAPLPWMSLEEQREDEAKWAQLEKARAERARQGRHEQDLEDAFETAFPAQYLKARHEFWRDIKKKLDANPEDDLINAWWDCLVNSDDVNVSGEHEREKAGMDAAETEVLNFRSLPDNQRYAPFDKLYGAAHARMVPRTLPQVATPAR